MIHSALRMPGRIRTCDLQSRSLTLYPTELRALNAGYSILFRELCQVRGRSEPPISNATESFTFPERRYSGPFRILRRVTLCSGSTS